MEVVGRFSRAMALGVAVVAVAACGPNGCGGQGTREQPPEGGQVGGDAGSSDAGPWDAARPDGSTQDAGSVLDAGPVLDAGRDAGPVLDAGPGPECASGFLLGEGGACEDIDECAEGLAGCIFPAACENHAGTFVCLCPDGYVSHGEKGCLDVDECAEGSASCDPLAACVNEPGGYRCGDCPAGFRGDGAVECTDLDECAEGVAECDVLVTCVNEVGGYRCGDCPTGYMGGGADGCIDIDECASAQVDCDPIRRCDNEPGTYACGPCPDGFYLDLNDRCVPLLIALTSPETLAPTFDSQTFAYDVRIPLLQSSVEWTPAVDPEALIRAEGVEHVSGTPAVIADPALGPHVYGLTPYRDSGEQSQYDVTVYRPEYYAELSSEPYTSSFGEAIALEDGVLVVGAPWDNSDSITGLNDTNLFSRGAATVYVRDGNDFRRTQMLYASNGESRDEFGVAVAISGDRIAVGAYRESGRAGYPDTDNSRSEAGAVYVFARSGGSWAEEARIKGYSLGGDWFGASLALDGDTLVVGAPYGGRYNTTPVILDRTGLAQVFRRQANGAWLLEADLPHPNPFRGEEYAERVAVSGDWALVAASGDNLDNDPVGDYASAGSVYAFHRSGTTWDLAQTLRPTIHDRFDSFGWSIGIDGPRVLIGALGEDSDPTAGLSDNSLDGAGAVYEFELQGSAWVQTQVIKAPDAVAGRRFGSSVALDGDLSLISGARIYNQGDGTYVFHREAPAWRFIRTLEYGEPSSLAVSGGAFVFGGRPLVRVFFGP